MIQLLIGLVIFVAIVAVIAWVSSGGEGDRSPDVAIPLSVVPDSPPEAHKPSKISPYTYSRKDYIMTRPEANLFRRLERIAGSKYYVFPQVHLSSLLNHQVYNGQDWRAALAKIQRKSVDFVLVDKGSLETKYAIELDDRTHDLSASRIQRDLLVNEIMLDAGIPLVRLRNVRSMSDEDISNTIAASRLSESYANSRAQASSNKGFELKM